MGADHWLMTVEAVVKFGAVTVMVLIVAGTLRIVGRLLGPNGAGDIEEARLRQDARRAARMAEGSERDG